MSDLSFVSREDSTPRKAETVEEMYLAFEPDPLESQQEMNAFYVDTMSVRTGDTAGNPIRKIEKACRRPRERNVFLLLGHRGCGKSTELNRMKLRLQAEGRIVETIQCEREMSLITSPQYSDLLILMADALLRIAKQRDVPVSDDTLKVIDSFWAEGTRTWAEITESGAEIGIGVTASSPPLLKRVLDLFAEVKSQVKYNAEARKEYKQKLTNRFDDWLMVLRRLSDGITEKTGKQPFLIFEGLDKMGPESAKAVFFSNPDKLSAVSFPVVFTFPVALFYHPDFSSLVGYFQYVNFPMLKLKDIDGNDYPLGLETVRKIVHQRIHPNLIDEGALDEMIRMTGGSLRDLFEAIRDAADRAENRDRDHVDITDAKRALLHQKSDITRRIEGEEHTFLANIMNGGRTERTEIKDRETLLRMMQARTLMEYNGVRWFNVHPLVAEYLRELGYGREGGKRP